MACDLGKATPFPEFGFPPQNKWRDGIPCPPFPASHSSAPGWARPFPVGKLHRPTGWGRGGAGWGSGELCPPPHLPPLTSKLWCPDGSEVVQGFGCRSPRPGSAPGFGACNFPGCGDHCRPLSVGIVLVHPLRPGGRLGHSPRLLSPSLGALPTTTRAKSARKSGAAERRLFDGLHPRFSSKSPFLLQGSQPSLSDM